MARAYLVDEQEKTSTFSFNMELQGQRRPHVSWRRTIDDERLKAAMTWKELKWLVQDRRERRGFVGALCSHNSTLS